MPRSLVPVIVTAVSVAAKGNLPSRLHCMFTSQEDEDVVIEYVAAPAPDIEELLQQAAPSTSNAAAAAEDDDGEERGYGGLGLAAAPGLGMTGLGFKKAEEEQPAAVDAEVRMLIPFVARCASGRSKKAVRHPSDLDCISCEGSNSAGCVCVSPLLPCRRSWSSSSVFLSASCHRRDQKMGKHQRLEGRELQRQGIKQKQQDHIQMQIVTKRVRLAAAVVQEWSQACACSYTACQD